MSRLKKGRVFYVPIDIATTPTEGWCFVGRWWTVHPNDGIAFYHIPLSYMQSENPSPQCNQDQFTSEHITKKIYPGHECRFIDVVYEGHALKAMKKDREQALRERAA